MCFYTAITWDPGHNSCIEMFPNCVPSKVLRSKHCAKALSLWQLLYGFLLVHVLKRLLEDHSMKRPCHNGGIYILSPQYAYGNVLIYHHYNHKTTLCKTYFFIFIITFGTSKTIFHTKWLNISNGSINQWALWKP